MWGEISSIKGNVARGKALPLGRRSTRRTIQLDLSLLVACSDRAKDSVVHVDTSLEGIDDVARVKLAVAVPVAIGPDRVVQPVIFVLTSLKSEDQVG